MDTVKFPKEAQDDFIVVLRRRIKDYFESNNIKSSGDWRMPLKFAVLGIVYFLPYSLMITGVITGSWAVVFAWFVMGLGMAGLGLSVMHDAIHGTFSSSKKVNKMVGRIIYLIGGFAPNWTIQHNMLHHSYTNIEGLDDDLHTGYLMRFSPGQKRLSHHKYQHLYSWFLYTLLTVSWMSAKDFMQFKKYKQKGFIKGFGKPSVVFAKLIFWKAVYFTFILVVPLIAIQAPWWLIIAGYFVMHLTAGFILSIIFQMAHIMPNSHYPKVTEKGSMENTWAVHQMLTTANFAPRNKFLNWYAGGLNFQVEHHLFPNICHVHYTKIAPIVKNTAKEFGIDYNSNDTFFKAVTEHYKMLKTLGNVDVIVPEGKSNLVAA